VQGGYNIVNGISRFLGIAAAALLATGCASQTSKGGGVSAEGLARLEQTVAADIERGRIPGVVMVVQRDGKTVLSRTLGKRDPANGAPMREDAIFRIYSMTKPIVSVGAMMLVEEGRLMLSDPVAKHIPELKDLKVGVEKDGRLETVAANRQPTIQDLFRHTSGFTYSEFGRSLVKEAYKKAGLNSVDVPNREFVRRLGTVPLQVQPATVFEYGRSTEVLGHVIERVTGQSLDVYLQTRIFGPLGMKDTAFSVDPEQHGRIAEPFAKDPDGGGTLAMLDIRKRPQGLYGGQGLTSTAADYLRFAQMLLNGGELGGVRLLSRKSVDFMASDHLGSMRGPGPGYGFGLGFAVRKEDGLSSTNGSAGDYNWAGYGGTYFWVDPKERLIGVWMMQAPNQRNYYRELFRNMVYSALD
jgi:CubicO group peptidase (beta-lactamase class C family)